jgi:D-alanine transaminase
MSRVAYVNGRYLPQAQAQVAIEDRGFQFADGVYEVCEVRAGRLVDERRHMARLDRSLNELRITRPMSHAALSVVLHETVRRNRVHDGIVYLQITRGVARRDFPFPKDDTRPSVVVTARSNDLAHLEQMAA